MLREGEAWYELNAAEEHVLPPPWRVGGLRAGARGPVGEAILGGMETT